MQVEQIRALVTSMATQAANGGRDGGQGQRGWDNMDRFRDIQLFDGSQKTFEEWAVKIRSVVKAGNVTVGNLLTAVETECSEEVMQEAMDPYRQLAPAFDERDHEFILDTSAKLYSILLSKTTGEANAVVRRTSSNGLLAWKRLVSSLNPRTLASGIKAISAVISPARVTQAARADYALDDWEDKIAKMHAEYGQRLTSRMKVAVMYSMMPRELQERISDACAVSWDKTDDTEAENMYTRIKGQLRNMAKAKRDLAGPRPMEVDRVTAEDEWGTWGVGVGSGDGWSWATHGGEPMACVECGDYQDEADINMIKGGGGFQGHCYICGEFGHSQMYCPYAKGKGKGKEQGQQKGYGKDKGYGKGSMTWKRTGQRQGSRR